MQNFENINNFKLKWNKRNICKSKRNKSNNLVRSNAINHSEGSNHLQISAFLTIIRMNEEIVVYVKVTGENIENKSYVCNNTGCLKQFNSEKSLKKHLLQHLSLTINYRESKVSYRFSCPINNCRRSLKVEGECFSTRKHLHQHYYKVHNNGMIACTNEGCKKTFSTASLRNLHLKNCGKVFSCHCNAVFNSNEALLTHQKRKHPDDAKNRKNKRDKSIQNDCLTKKRKSENPPTTREVSTTTSGLGLWNSNENLSFPPNIANTTSVFTSTDQPISSFAFETKPKLIKNSSTSTAEDFIKEENSNSLSSSCSQTKKNINWNLVSGNDFDDVSNPFDAISDNDMKLEFYSAETQTDFSDNLFNNNYTQTTFADFYDFERFDNQTQTNWDE